jgi:DNA repair protein RadD
MTFQPRDYQDAIIDETRVKLRTSRRVLVQLPTGGGKTVVGGKMIESAASKGHRAFFTVHRRELIDQTVATFNDVGIPHGVVAPAFMPRPLERVQVCSIDTLKHRIQKQSGILVPPKFIMVDEAHHVAAAGWRKVLEAFPDAFVVGLSATPERLDGKGLDDIFDDIVVGPSTRWLIENGFLCDYRAFAPTTPDLSGVHTSMGDYAKGEASAAMDKPKITGDAIKHYQRLARGKSAVAFCVSVEHSQHVAASFREAGIVAWHVDGTTPAGERAEAIRAFRNGEIRVLSNVDLLGEGFDLPSLDVSILLRPTKSLALYLQQVGRALRIAPGKKRALILDHAGNIARHGLPDDEREWSLAGRDKRKKKAGAAIDARQCPVCFALHRPAPKCPECGHEYGTAPRTIEEVEGELLEIDVAEQRRQTAREQAMARTIEELVELGKRRNYKNPAAWAAHVMTARMASARRGSHNA